jgi:hypothetical protein
LGACYFTGSTYFSSNLSAIKQPKEGAEITCEIEAPGKAVVLVGRVWISVIAEGGLMMEIESLF